MYFYWDVFLYNLNFCFTIKFLTRKIINIYYRRINYMNLAQSCYSNATVYCFQILKNNWTLSCTEKRNNECQMSYFICSSPDSVSHSFYYLYYLLLIIDINIILQSRCLLSTKIKKKILLLHLYRTKVWRIIYTHTLQRLVFLERERIIFKIFFYSLNIFRCIEI